MWAQGDHRASCKREEDQRGGDEMAEVEVRDWSNVGPWAQKYGQPAEAANVP